MVKENKFQYMYINTLALSDKTAIIFILGAQSIAGHFSIFRIHTTSCSLVHLRPLTTLTGASRVQGPTIPAVPTFICLKNKQNCEITIIINKQYMFFYSTRYANRSSISQQGKFRNSVSGQKLRKHLQKHALICYTIHDLLHVLYLF